MFFFIFELGEVKISDNILVLLIMEGFREISIY